MIESVHKNLEKYLAIIEADSSASWPDIESKYRQLIHRWHPDRNLGENNELAQLKFIEINSAYKALKEHYRKNGAIPRPVPNGELGRIHGAKKVTVEKPALYKNKYVLATTFCFALLMVFVGILWSMDSTLEKNNRHRAKVERTAKQQTTIADPTQGSTNFKRQTAKNVEP